MSISAWNELIGTLYRPKDRAKIEWAFGAITSGDYKKIKKLVIITGPQRSGKTTILNIAKKMFGATVLIHEDVDLAKIPRVFQGSFLITSRIDPPMFDPNDVGIARRVLVVYPSGNTIPLNRYQSLVARIDLELNEIKEHCAQVYSDTIV